VSAGAVEGGDVGFEKVGEQGRDRLAGEMSGDELVGEERIAFPAAYKLIDESWWRRDPERGGRLDGDRAPIKPGQYEAFDPAQAAELRNPPTQQRIAADLVRPERADKYDALVDKVAGQVFEHVPR
jgi:hypothetical protein